MNIIEIENKLNSFDSQERKSAVCEVRTLIDSGELSVKEDTDAHNLHCHTIFSYNGYGFSPSYIAYLAKKEGWFAAGIVDFDVLDAVDEFLDACKTLGVRGVCGLETRAYLSEFSSREINSPGEPGITYHMGIGFTQKDVSSESETAAAFLKSMKQSAQDRTRDLVNKVNSFLSPVEVDFEKDAMSLTPDGNVTERHVCQSFENKAKATFPDSAKLAEFWAEKLGVEADEAVALINDSVKLQGKIRSKTMKSGGVGYVKPTAETFPFVKDVNDFILAAGAIPTITWLNGLSDGEQAIDELLDLQQELGGAVLNIVPDRNWNIADADEKAAKLAELAKIVEICESRNLPVIVGTEMNAPGLKLVDTFDSEELKPYTQIFKKGAAIVYAHTILQSQGKGYLSEWAKSEFANIAEKNAYFAEIGMG